MNSRSSLAVVDLRRTGPPGRRAEQSPLVAERLIASDFPGLAALFAFAEVLLVDDSLSVLTRLVFDTWSCRMFVLFAVLEDELTAPDVFDSIGFGIGLL